MVVAAFEGLIDRARTLEDLEHQGLQLLAARRWRELDRPVPDWVVAQERIVAACSLAAPIVLRRIRAAYDGDLLLLKGPEAAASYPDPVLRPYGDLDLLVADAPAAQRALIGAGFEPVGDERRYLNMHHLQPLRLPELPLMVEVHRAPHWPDRLKPPSVADLLEAGVAGRCGVEGILGLPPAQHAILLAAHAWADAPLGNLRQLLDIALVAADAGPTDWGRLAERWGASAFWNATIVALNNLCGARLPPMLRLWARHLGSVRSRTVFEAHLTSWISPLWCLSGPQGLKAAAAAFAADLRPTSGEGWRVKLQRTRVALSNASMSAAEHYARLNRSEPSEQDACAARR